MNQHCMSGGGSEPSVKIAREPSIRDLTLILEYASAALRALADGHAPASRAVIEPTTWASSILRELVILPPKDHQAATKTG